MVKRYGLLLGSFLVFGCSTIAAPEALGAEHHHLVSLRHCNGVLTAADFDDGLEEVSAATFTHAHQFSAETSSCAYAGLTEAGDASHKDLVNGELGDECVGNILQLAKEEKKAPPGGCYRIVHSALIVTTGPRVTKLLSKLRRGVKDKVWPSGVVRHIAHGIGNRAEWGYGAEEKGYAYLQVLNATIMIETQGSVSLLHTLRLAAATL